MKIPAQIHEIFCPICRSRIEFPLFMASFYDFETYKEIKSQQIIRIDLQFIHYQKLQVSDLLKAYSEKQFGYFNEQDWINLGKKSYCPKCQKYFQIKEGRNLRFCIEETIEATILPET